MTADALLIKKGAIIIHISFIILIVCKRLPESCNFGGYKPSMDCKDKRRSCSAVDIKFSCNFIVLLLLIAHTFLLSYLISGVVYVAILALLIACKHKKIVLCNWRMDSIANIY